MTEKRVLIVLSSSPKIVLQNNKEKMTGFFLSELIVPLQQMRERGWTIVYTNSTGLTPTLDPLSNKPLWFGLDTIKFEKATEDLNKELLAGLRTPTPFAAITEAVLETIDAVFIPGGHAPMDDLANNHELGRILKHFHSYKKPTGAICHGSVALLSTIEIDKPWIYNGYQMTCYSNKEELLNEIMWKGRLKFRVETSLKNEGAVVRNRLPLLPNVVVDRELITGQGPTSVNKFAKVFVSAVHEWNKSAVIPEVKTV